MPKILSHVWLSRSFFQSQNACIEQVAAIVVRVPGQFGLSLGTSSHLSLSLSICAHLAATTLEVQNILVESNISFAHQ